MNQLSKAKRVQVIRCLVEGCSVRSTVRMTGVAKDTVLKLLVDIGRACSEYQDRTLRGLTCRRIQCDEIWAYIGAKEKNVPPLSRGQLGIGDAWTWVWDLEEIVDLLKTSEQSFELDDSDD